MYRQKQPIYKKWWFWVIAVVIVFMVISNGKPSDSLNSNNGESKVSIVTMDDTSTDNGSSAADNPATLENTVSSETAYEIGDGIVRVWNDSIGSSWISVAVPVKNTGTANLFLSSGTIDIEDENGSLVKTLELVSVYPQVLLPGETAYYYEETILDESVSSSSLKAIPHTDIKKSKVECVRYEVTETTVKDTDYFGAKVVGRVQNNTDKPESMVYVVANLFDSEGKLIVQQFTILSNELQPGEKIGFETSNLGYNVSAKDVADYEVYAFPLQFQF